MTVYSHPDEFGERTNMSTKDEVRECECLCKARSDLLDQRVSAKDEVRECECLCKARSDLLDQEMSTEDGDNTL